MSKSVFSGGSTLGLGLGDWGDWFGSSDAEGEKACRDMGMGWNQVTKECMEEKKCPGGQVEFGSPSRCGTPAEYEAYVKGQVAQAYGGDEKKATQYLQTTAYGQERGMGCSAPNKLINGVYSPDGVTPPHSCLTPSEYDKYLKAGGKKVAGSGGPGGPGVKTNPVTPQPGPPIEAGVDLLPIVAIVGLLAVGGFLVYRKRQKAKGFSQNPYDFDAEED